ncbi:MAG TPA: RNA polymerase factor sigma-54 [Solimonas sp.]
MKAQVRQQMNQQLAMTPQLLQSIRLLQLSNLELEQELRQALEVNVMLEDAADDADEDGDETAPQDPVSDADDVGERSEVSGADAAAHTQLESDFEWSSAESWSGGEPFDEEGESWEARTAAPEIQDARLAALEQLQLVVRTPRQARLLEVMLDAVDDNGYLAQPLDGIALESGLQPQPDEAELEATLTLLQSVEPTGFGARDLRECLLLQLNMRPEGTRGRSLAEFIVAACLDRVASGDFAELREALGIDALELHDALDLILSLNPKPGAALAAPAQAVSPDLVVFGRRGAWKVELSQARLPRLRVNRQYERTITQTAGHKALRDQLQEARWLVRGLEMRHDTLLRAARAIFERQHGFLERGEEGMAPLTLREIADAIGMHESTICRVTSQKWVQTPWGVYELKAFFPSQIAGASGETSGTAVKAMIRKIINGESRNSPLCDGDITAILARNGVHVARRTVAKYREAMQIAPVKERIERQRAGRAVLRI